jgi:hypothetical protein
VKRALGALGAAALAGCTSASLYGDKHGSDPDKAAFVGHLCTDDPADRQFPVKVLFLIDTTIGDYGTQRANSIQRVIQSYSGPNYSYAVIRYAGPLRGTTCGLRNLTPDGFATMIPDAISGVRCSESASDPGRDVLGVLSNANALLSGDVLATKRGIRSRTKYVVILLANGPPSVSLSDQWCHAQDPIITDPTMCQMQYFNTFCADLQPPVTPPDCENAQYTQLVKQMKSFVLDNGAQEFYFHVVYQRDPSFAASNMDDPKAIDLYRAISVIGGGPLITFPGPAVCSTSSGDSAGCLFSEINLDTTQSVFLRRQLIVSNRNALATPTGLLPDSDGDGLSDAYEMMIGTDPTNPDTDGDHLNDRLEHLLRSTGLDPLVNNLPTSSTSTNGMNWPKECPLPGFGSPNAFPPDQDQDGDGLTDCEEILLRSDPTSYDTDADGIADPLEFRYGTNLLVNDADQDYDNDGFSNIEEYKLHLDPLSKDPNTDFVYQYTFQNETQRMSLAYSQPLDVTGAQIIDITDQSHPGRGTIYYTPPADPTMPVSMTNPAKLAWRDPEDIKLLPGMSDPGRGPDVLITGDGHFQLPSASFDPMDPNANLVLTVDITAMILPKDPYRDDVRVRTSQRFCFDVKVSNVQLLNTLPDPSSGKAGMNYIDLFLAEVPANNAQSLGVFRVATVPLQYPQAPNLKMVPRRDDIPVADEDFLLYGE